MSIVIRKGTLADAGAFFTLLREVRQGMPHPEWFYLDSPEEIRAQLEKGIMHLWLAEEGKTLAAAASILTPGTSPLNYGHCLHMTEEQLNKSVNMDSVAVHPNYRGQGLQRKLAQTAETWIRAEGYETMLCTIHPDNRFSLENTLAQGFSVRDTIAIYGSVRHLLQKNIEK